MTTPYLIFDIVILLILAVFALLGAKRGLLLSLCGLLAVLVAFIGASAVSDVMAPKVAAYLEPKFAAALEQRLEEQIQSASWQSNGSAGAAGAVTPDDLPLQDVLNVLKDMGFYQSAVDAVDKAVRAGMTEVAASAAAAAAVIAGTAPVTPASTRRKSGCLVLSITSATNSTAWMVSMMSSAHCRTTLLGSPCAA